MGNGVVENENFINFLRELLRSKQKVNKKYSLRAFANLLDINASTLSQIFHGKRRLSDGACLKLGKKLGLNLKEIDALMLGHNLAVPNYQKIKMYNYEKICQWYHYAILELTHLSCFRADILWMAQTLSLDSTIIREAIEQLREVELLIIDEEGNWIDQSNYLSTTEYEFTTSSLQNMQKQILEKAIVAMKEIPFEKRSQSSTTLQVSSKQMELAKKKITQFKRELTELLQNDETTDEVYHLSVSLYPVTQNYSLGVL